ncbi:MAG TPA: transketolase [Patescibacteria group bacterium]
MNDLLEKAKLVRKWCMVSTTEAGSGHPTSSMSAADVMTVLFDKYFTYDLKNPQNLANDRLIFSKGHASPLYYTMYALAGAFPIDELKTLRKINSRLEGHPTPEFPYTEAATGSLGQGLSVGAGLALAMQREKTLTQKPFVYVLLGDGEMAEGQVWEAANFAAYHKISNLIAIVDVNRLGQSQETMFGHHTEEYANRLTAFGWEVMVIDGHDMAQVTDAFEKATKNTSGKPFAIVAKTEKGHGISFLANADSWHGKPLPKDMLEKALQELGPLEDKQVFTLRVPQTIATADKRAEAMITIPYKVGDSVATREVYGSMLAQLGKENESIVALDAEVKNSTYSIDFMKVFPDRFVECFIAEQNMVSVAAGFARFGKTPFVSTFAAFLTRGADQVRMAWLSQAGIKFVGSHAGVSIGEDGASQMGLEEVSLFGTLPDVVVLQPSEAVSAAKLLQEITKIRGMAYVQTLRPKTKVLYETTEEFPIGGSKVLRQKDTDAVAVVATGITVEEALKAADILEKEGITITVVDAYSISPIDKKTLLEVAQKVKTNTIITVEDHFIHGGMGDFAIAAVSENGVKVVKMAVIGHSHSGTKDELLDRAGISASHIVEKVKSLVK